MVESSDPGLRELEFKSLLTCTLWVCTNGLLPIVLFLICKKGSSGPHCRAPDTYATLFGPEWALNRSWWLLLDFKPALIKKQSSTYCVQGNGLSYMYEFIIVNPYDYYPGSYYPCATTEEGQTRHPRWRACPSIHQTKARRAAGKWWCTHPFELGLDLLEEV